MAERQRRWQILIEELMGGGQAMVWRPNLLETTYPHPEPARQAAYTLAHQHDPRHPFSKGRRTVLCVDENSFLVVIEGATMDAHFRVNVTEVVSVTD